MANALLQVVFCARSPEREFGNDQATRCTTLSLFMHLPSGGLPRLFLRTDAGLTILTKSQTL
jgi:hypothetical protein